MNPKYLLLFVYALVIAGCSSRDKTSDHLLTNGTLLSSKTVFNIRDFPSFNEAGLKTKAVQDAIDTCSRQGGGKVLVPKGKYVIGTIELKSNVILCLAKGAELLGSYELDDYSSDVHGAVEAPAYDRCLIYAKNAENVGIAGHGVIDGRGHEKHWPIWKDEKKLSRPMLIRFVNCDNVIFRDITLNNAAAWCTHLVDCEDIDIRNVNINSKVNANNDGFDLSDCKNVLIENCHIVSGDDSICLKSINQGGCENIIVRNCHLSSNTAAFKCGTSSKGGFRDVIVTDCKFYDCRMGAIKLLVVDGGVLENVTVSNIEMDNVEGPVFIRLGNRGRLYDKPTQQNYNKDVKNEGAPVGKLRNVLISNIKATVNGDDKKMQGIMITGIPGHRIEDIVLEDIQISYSGRGTIEDAKVQVPEDIARYPEQSFFGVLPCYGCFIRHAKDISLKNVTLSLQQQDFRPAVYTEDVEGFRIYNCNFPASVE